MKALYLPEVVFSRTILLPHIYADKTPENYLKHVTLFGAGEVLTMISISLNFIVRPPGTTGSKFQQPNLKNCTDCGNQFAFRYLLSEQCITPNPWGLKLRLR